MCDQQILRSACVSAQSDQSLDWSQLPGYPKMDKQEPLPYLVDIQADRVFAGHTCFFLVLLLAGSNIIAAIWVLQIYLFSGLKFWIQIKSYIIVC